ncbi:MAG TPA: oligosaccharide flippase family protein [Candidatus Cloacimonadota bacterium]|nr:oligosaccharide flippase family protein [Candidatus Cloacimonadota bacterium]
MNYSQAIILPREDHRAINLLILSFSGTLFIAVGLLLLSICMPAFILDLMKSSNGWFLVLLVIATILTGLNESLQAWCVRVKAFKNLASSQVIRSVASNGSQSALGLWKGNAFFLVSGMIFGELLASFYLTRSVLQDLVKWGREISWQGMKELGREYRDFPLYGGSKDIMNAVSMGLPVLLLSQYYGLAVAGAYAFGVRIIQIPMGFITRSLRPVLFQKASESHNQGERLFPLYLKSTAGLFTAALIPMLFFFRWAPDIFVWIFGAEWQTAGEFAKWLLLWLVLVFSGLPSVLFARITRIQGQLFVFEVVLLVSRTLVLILGGIYLHDLDTIILFSLTSAGLNIIFILIVGHIVMKEDGLVRDGQVQKEINLVASTDDYD